MNFTKLMDGNIDIDDLNIIKRTRGVEAVIPNVYKGEIMRYGNESKTGWCE